MRIVAEQGVAIPPSVLDGTHRLLASLARSGRTKDICVSVAKAAHPLDYFEADAFVRVPPSSSNMLEPETTDVLMRTAAVARRRAMARVGAALLTNKGSILCSVERRPRDQNPDQRNLAEEFGGMAAARGGEFAALVELLDASTSIHAELIVLADCLAMAERPVALAVTRLPCLACCRSIRLAGVPYTTYLSHRNYAAAGPLLSALIHEALDGMVLQLFEGTGGRAGASIAE